VLQGRAPPHRNLASLRVLLLTKLHVALRRLTMRERVDSVTTTFTDALGDIGAFALPRLDLKQQ
jgi:hypothetical protein